MVRGLDIFRDRLFAFTDQFVLIGGTAASAALGAAGLEFRGTKDLDIVLHVETLTADFARAFWAFVNDGRYSVREQMQRPRLYRFERPEDERFPFMLELFSRSQEALPAENEAMLTPISFGGAASRLSAILLDEAYYSFLRDGRLMMDGLPMIGVDRLIPLKAYASLDLTRRHARGEQIDSRDIRKHTNDVFRLSQLLVETDSFEIALAIQGDLKNFLTAARDDDSINLRTLGIRRVTRNTLLERIATAYRITPF